MELINRMKKRIDESEKGSISFYDFMDMALYESDLGYYSRSKKKIGKEGDFYTNASVGTIFGEVLADIFEEMILTSEHGDLCHLIEFGGGTGELTWQILEEWKRNGSKCLSLVKPIMIEKSPFHRQLQQEKLAQHDVTWYETWENFMEESGRVKGIVFSNELLDAFPVYLLEYTGAEWMEVRVAWDHEASALVECNVPLDHPEIQEYLQREEIEIPNISGYRIEVNLGAIQWLKEVASGLESGYIVTIDYGYERKELYLAQRKKGTLMCYRNHIASDTPFIDPGEQDITAHVNFSAIMEAGEEVGLSNLAMFTQSQFLINGGILKKLQNNQETDPFLGVITKRNRAIRQLIMPGGMGDMFKILVQAKGHVNLELELLKSKGWI